MCKTETSHICSHAVVFVGLLSYLMFGGKTRSSIIFVLCKWPQNDVVKKSMRRDDVASTFIGRHLRHGPLGYYCLLIYFYWTNQINPLYIGGLFLYNILGESICHFRGVGSILLRLFYF